MIFVTVGSQKFEFNRLLKKIDELVEKGVIKEAVFAQTGYSSYVPENYEYKQFMNQDEFIESIKKSRIIIAHAGTGTIIKCVKNNKTVIVVPRLAKFNEHVDDHQLQIAKAFENIIIPVLNMDKLGDAIAEADTKKVVKYKSNTERVVKSIEAYIESEFCEVK